MYNPGSKRDGFSVGIFGEAGALDWTGRGARSGGGAEAGSRDGVSARAQKNGISADMQMWRDAGAVDPKKLQQNRWGRGGALLLVDGVRSFTPETTISSGFVVLRRRAVQRAAACVGCLVNARNVRSDATAE